MVKCFRVLHHRHTEDVEQSLVPRLFFRWALAVRPFDERTQLFLSIFQALFCDLASDQPRTAAPNPNIQDVSRTCTLRERAFEGVQIQASSPAEPVPEANEEPTSSVPLNA